MKRIAIPREMRTGETRAAIDPNGVKKLARLGAEVTVESGIGASIRADDAAYKEAGAEIATDREAMLRSAEIVLRLNKPPAEEVAWLPAGCLHVSLLEPFAEEALVRDLARAKISAVAMDMMPRSTRAQKMDAISSQANLAGYASVIVAADRSDKILPMMMTPAGTIAPTRVLVIGAGVAGLQAIATARRLGARVEAFDTRPEAREQIESLGARAVRIDLGETEATKDGYAKALTPEQLAMQQAQMVSICGNMDIVITTAQVFGRKAPITVTEDMLAAMKPGSVVVDLAVSTGGNVVGSKLDEEIEIGGVRVVGLANLPGTVAAHATQMYGSNLVNFIDEFWDPEAKAFALPLDDDLILGCLLTHGGDIIHPMIKERYGA
ncbi:MAG: NAD(P) transhydrogenase subunit alpha [Rhodothermales bacterium]